jgi:hypothetical protein
MAYDVGGSGARAEEGNVRWVAAEFRDVVMQPFVGSTLVSEAIVSSTFLACGFVVVTDKGIGGKAEKAYPEIEGDKHDRFAALYTFSNNSASVIKPLGA